MTKPKKSKGKFELPSVEEMRIHMAAVEKDQEDRRLERGKYAPPTGECVVCEGKVIARITHEYLGDPMNFILGPGGRNQMSRIHHGWHCTICGLRYEFLPKGKN